MNAVSENAAIFDFLGDEAAIATLNQAFDGERTFSQPVTSRATWAQEIDAGLSRQSFNHLFDELIENCPVDPEFIDNTRIILEPAGSQSPRVSAVSTIFAVRVVTLYAMLQHVLKSSEDAVRFLISRHPELNTMTPLEAALTTNGGKNVIEVISRGLHGLPV
jgi:hypothetical protein